MEKSQRIAGLDLLRSIAIVAVFLSHFQSKTTVTVLKTIGHYGWCGVDLFFVLSGYLIANQLFSSLKLRGDISLKSFYWRRALRILPCYGVVLGIYLVWPDFREGNWIVPPWKFLTFTQNFNLTFSSFSHAWSLCIEEQFYWAFPLMVLLLSSKKNAPRMAVPVVILFGMAVRALVWSEVLHRGLNADTLNREYFRLIYYPTYSRLDGLTLGIAIALVRHYVPNLWVKMGQQANALAIVGCVIVGLALHLFDDHYKLSTVVIGFPLLALGFACLVATAAQPQTLLANLQIPGSATVAALAYCIYLTHKQVIHLVTGLLDSHRLMENSPLRLPVFGIAVLCCAFLLHVLVERPFLRLRQQKGRPYLFVSVRRHKVGEG